MDAASNRSVNDMARIRENVQFGPMENRFKTYIVDEAHQLSTDAKDAFLKTLEEPPPNVVFILATTESHAIPVTIASRCQQFDFKRGSILTLSQQVERVLGYEGLTMAPDAVGILARAAEGSYRDALSLLEQVLAYKREDVTPRDVTDVLGAVDGEVIASVIDTIASSDGAEAFAIAERVFTGGKDVRQFLKMLASRYRDMLYVAVGAKTGDTAVIGDVTSLAAQAKQFTPPTLLKSLEILAEAERETKYMNQHRLLLEMTLLKLMHVNVEPVAVAAPAPAPTRQAAPVARPVVRAVEPTPIDDLPPPPTNAPPAEYAPAPVAPVQAPPPSSRPAPPPMYNTGGSSRPAQAPIPATVAAAPASGPGHDVHESREQADYLRTHWQQVVNHVQARSPGGVKVFQDCRPVAQEKNVVILGFENKAYLDMLENVKRRQFIEEIINKILRVENGTFRVRGILNSAFRGPAPQAPVQAAPAPRPAPVAAAPVETQQSLEDESPLLDEVISIFGGKVTDEE